MSKAGSKERLEEVENRLAFQDDVIEKLNAVVTHQDAEIRHLSASLKRLEESLKEIASGMSASGDGEAPPHY